jgi:short-subunit dehydrogenase
MLIGNSDGIGLATSRRLLSGGWEIIGVSRSESPISNPSYRHRVISVSDHNYSDVLSELAASGPLDLCIYFAGIGGELDPLNMDSEVEVFEVNLLGMVKTAAVVIPQMVRNGQGHFLGLSSLADELVSAESPSYTASKAGFSTYLKGLALALKPKGVYVTNVRFGFVDTKMAKGDTKPLMMSVEKAVDRLEYCIKAKPASISTHF